MEMDLDSTIASIMTKEVVCVEPQQKLIDLKHIYERPDFHSHVPVTKDDKLIGIVSLINFMRAIHDASLDDNEAVYHNLNVNDIMTPNPTTVSSNISIRSAAEILAEGRFHSLIVSDDGAVSGILTTTDLIKHMLK